jgi:hypothetical protein
MNPKLEAAGALTTCVAALNSFFQLLNPILTGIFYILSIGWLMHQIYIKYKKNKS